MRKSDKLMRGVALSPRLAFVCGGMLGFIGVVLLTQGVWSMGALICGLGVALAVIGKSMQ